MNRLPEITQEELIELIGRHSCNLLDQRSSQIRMILSLAESNSPYLMKAILAEHPEAADDAFLAAAAKGDTRAALWVETHGATPTPKALIEATYQAAARGDHNTVQTLRFLGQALLDQLPQKTLELASCRGNAPAARWCLNNGALATSKAMMMAAVHGHYPVVRALLEHGGQLEHGGLVAAATGGQERLARVFMSHGVAPDGQVLSAAIKSGCKTLVSRLLNMGLHPQDSDLHTAAKLGHTATVVLLLDWGMKPNLETVCTAAWNRHGALMRLLGRRLGRDTGLPLSSPTALSLH